MSAKVLPKYIYSHFDPRLTYTVADTPKLQLHTKNDGTSLWFPYSYVRRTEGGIDGTLFTYHVTPHKEVEISSVSFI